MTYQIQDLSCFTWPTLQVLFSHNNTDIFDRFIHLPMFSIRKMLDGWHVTTIESIIVCLDTREQIMMDRQKIR